MREIHRIDDQERLRSGAFTGQAATRDLAYGPDADQLAQIQSKEPFLRCEGGIPPRDESYTIFHTSFDVCETGKNKKFYQVHLG